MPAGWPDVSCKKTLPAACSWRSQDSKDYFAGEFATCPLGYGRLIATAPCATNEAGSWQAGNSRAALNSVGCRRETVVVVVVVAGVVAVVVVAVAVAVTVVVVAVVVVFFVVVRLLVLGFVLVIVETSTESGLNQSALWHHPSLAVVVCVVCCCCRCTPHFKVDQAL
ncbi:unnamed protein product [Polarella glacialis]|uniref:Uncharacterized protein n=1 Tax=Polarella glacialis TaxID=89957 RepID=A0A813E0X0_POLGL|nr:unnamed protein product [Polarella glacialis]